MLAKKNSLFWLDSNNNQVLPVRQTACGCGCGLNAMAQTTIDMISLLMQAADLSTDNISADRGASCAAYNKQIGGAADSRHLPDTDGISHAVDLGCAKYDCKIVYIFVRGLFQTSPGLGYYPYNNFVHIDDRPDAVRWVRIIGNEYIYEPAFDFWNKYIFSKNL